MTYTKHYSTGTDSSDAHIHIHVEVSAKYKNKCNLDTMEVRKNRARDHWGGIAKNFEDTDISNAIIAWQNGDRPTGDTSTQDLADQAYGMGPTDLKQAYEANQITEQEYHAGLVLCMLTVEGYSGADLDKGMQNYFAMSDDDKASVISYITQNGITMDHHITEHSEKYGGSRHTGSADDHYDYNEEVLDDGGKNTSLCSAFLVYADGPRTNSSGTVTDVGQLGNFSDFMSQDPDLCSASIFSTMAGWSDDSDNWILGDSVKSYVKDAINDMPSVGADGQVNLDRATQKAVDNLQDGLDDLDDSDTDESTALTSMINSLKTGDIDLTDISTEEEVTSYLSGALDGWDDYSDETKAGLVNDVTGLLGSVDTYANMKDGLYSYDDDGNLIKGPAFRTLADLQSDHSDLIGLDALTALLTVLQRHKGLIDDNLQIQTDLLQGKNDKLDILNAAMSALSSADKDDTVDPSDTFQVNGMEFSYDQLGKQNADDGYDSTGYVLFNDLTLPQDDGAAADSWNADQRTNFISSLNTEAQAVNTDIGTRTTDIQSATDAQKTCQTLITNIIDLMKQLDSAPASKVG